MKKYSYLSLFLITLIGCKPSAPFNQEEVRQQITLAETQAILYTLAGDEMKGRDTKSGGYYRAADYVQAYFEKHNILPFYPTYRDSLVTDSLPTFNMVGSIGAYDAQKSTLMIGAHLDHLGIREVKGDSIFNGANDNAAGSTAVLQIARFLAQHQWDKNIIVALFADEEKGLKGAFHLAKKFKEEKISLDYMVNFEMIGTTLTTGENQVYMTGFELSNMAKSMNAISPNFVQFLPQAKEYNLFKRSDNYSFYEVLGIPAQTLSSFDFKNYDFYHKAGDEAEKLAVANMNQIIGTAAYTLATMLANKAEIKMNPRVE